MFGFREDSQRERGLLGGTVTGSLQESAEFTRRLELWNRLREAGGPSEVPAALLRGLRIYGGARGIWVDKTLTGAATADGNGITVSLLAAEQGPYPDALAVGRYEFPSTRVPGWDEASVEATKEADRQGLPVFLILRWAGSGNRRAVRRVRIAGWNNSEGHFLLEPYADQSTPPQTSAPVRRNAERIAMTQERLKVPAIRIRQGKKTFYVAAIPAADVLKIAKVDVWHSGDENPGYQRAPELKRKNKIAAYLARDDAVLPLGGLLNARHEGEGEASPSLNFFPDGLANGAITPGTLELPPADEPLWIVDMQHRLGGFEVALQRGEDVAGFPVVVTIADGLSRLEEIEQFELINTTQKKVQTDLARRLLGIRAQDGADAESLRSQSNYWTARGGHIVDWLNGNCPVWRGGIIEPNASKQDRPNGVTKETSFVTSLKPVLNTPLLSRATDDEVAELLSWFWQGLAQKWGQAFADPRNYVVQKTPGIFSLHSIATDVLELARQDGDLSRASIARVLEGLEVDSDFWHKANGTAGQFGSMKGFAILAEELRSYLPSIDLSMR